MKWRYCIPHQWPPGERMTWADILLLPESDYDGQSLWLTVDAVPRADPAGGKKDAHRRRRQLAALGRADYALNAAAMDLTVRAEDFDEAECLQWVERWLADRFECSGLVRGTLEDFAGRSAMADTIRAITEPREE